MREGIKFKKRRVYCQHEILSAICRMLFIFLAHNAGIASLAGLDVSLG